MAVELVPRWIRGLARRNPVVHRLRSRLADADVRYAYETLLKRSPSPSEVADALRVHRTVPGLLEMVLSSREYASGWAMRGIPRTDANGNRDSDRYYRMLASSEWDEPSLERAMRELSFPIDNPYFTAHRRRFVELLMFLDAHNRLHPVQTVMEVGCTYSTAYFYRHLLPDMRLVTIDRPIAHGGESAEWGTAAGASAHYNVDLNTAALSPSLGGPVQEKADFIVCTEVVEHLLADPAEIIADALGLLAHGGIVYLTTPNFLSARSLAAMADRRNPLSRFSKEAGNTEAHYHMREYTMEELEGAAQEAGAMVHLAAYSSCWDDEAAVAQFGDNAALRSNLVMVLGRAGDPSPLYPR